MNDNRNDAGTPDESRKSEIREAITDADATGIIANEEQIAQFETLRTLLPPVLPHEDLHAALPQGHAAHASIDQLRAEIEGTSPNRQSIETHVGQLRSLPELEATVANWWDDPRTQTFITSLIQIGL